MQIRRYIVLGSILSIAILFQASLSMYAEGEKAGPEEIEVDMHIRAEWLPLFPSSDAPSTARSALRILRAVDPENEEPYDKSKAVFGCNPMDLRRAFLLEKEEFLLGEPLLVEFRITLDGPGEWRERVGGNYRARGRDDNFFFLMRHEDGTWVRDPYAPINFSRGGIVSSYEVKQNKPNPYWLAVQRWCAIDRPGTYDLYCFQTAHGQEVLGKHQALVAGMSDELKRDHSLDADGALIDSRTGERSERYSIAASLRRPEGESSPLVEDIPADVATYARKSRNVMDFAHFRIAIRQGTDAERQQMVKHWTNIAESKERRSTWSVTARSGIQFAQQDDFIPLIEKWIGDKTRTVAFSGLAMRPNPRVADILLRTGAPNAVAAMRFLRPEQVPDVIPQLIERLTYQDNHMRARSEERLCAWTGQAFHRDWRGYDSQRPTLEEGRRMQLLWADWWRKNKDSFKPITRYDEQKKK